MGMDDVEIMLFHVFYGLIHVIVGLQMSIPWYSSLHQRLRKKRNKSCRRLRVTRSKQCYIMPLGHLLLHKIGNDNLCASIVFCWSSNPWRSYMRNSHKILLFHAYTAYGVAINRFSLTTYKTTSLLA